MTPRSRIAVNVLATWATDVAKRLINQSLSCELVCDQSIDDPDWKGTRNCRGLLRSARQGYNAISRCRVLKWQSHHPFIQRRFHSLPFFVKKPKGYVRQLPQLQLA